MKRTSSALAVAALGLGLTVAGIAGPAAAQEVTPEIATIDCETGTLTINLEGYSVIPGSEEVPIIGEISPANPGVSHTDYVYRTLFGTERIAHKDSGAAVFYDGRLWFRVGVVATPHVEGATDPVLGQVGVIPAVEANDTPNTVAVEVGDDLASDVFGETYSVEIAIAPGESYTVTVDAYDAEPAVVAQGVSECEAPVDETDAGTGAPLASTGGSSTAGKELAHTGAETTPLLVGAAALLALGGIAFGATRRTARNRA